MIQSNPARPCVAVAGGTGFVGQSLARQLSDAGYAVRVLTRRPTMNAALAVLPAVSVRRIDDMTQPAQWADALSGCVAFINLVGVLHATPAVSFEDAHVHLVQTQLAACRAAGVARFVQVSALGASAGAPSAYLRSKAAAEALVRASGLAWTILQPSVIFGAGDGFLNLFARLQRLLPVMVLACPEARFQPVHVEDVAQAVVRCLVVPDAEGVTLQLGGPEQFTLRALIGLVGSWTGYHRPVLGLSPGLSMLQAAVMEWLPVPLMTRDNVRSMQVPNVCTVPPPDWLQWQPSSLRLVVPGYLQPGIGRARYGQLRQHAGR